MTFRPRIDAEDYAITQEASFAIADWTTTTSGVWVQTDLSFFIAMPNSHICLFAWCDLCVEHSVAGANADFEVDIYKDAALVNYYSLMYKNGIYIAQPGASGRVSVSMSAGLDVVANLPQVVRPGSRDMVLWVKNNTPGTLTLKTGRILHAFVTGDDSV